MNLARVIATLVLVGLGASLALGTGAAARADQAPPAATRDPGPANIPPELMDIGVDEHLDAQVPLDTTFKDETGKVVQLKDYVDGKRPILLVLAYHTCPVLCSMVQNAVLEGIKAIGWSVGVDYDVITLSIDPRDTVSVAAEKKAAMVGSYGRPEAAKGWHFLVGDEQNISRVTSAIGWKYHYDERQGQYAHPSAVTLLKPNARVARYLYGIEFSPQDLKLGLLEASEGKSISTVERIILYCYHYDPQDRKYSIVAMHVMQVGGAITLVLLSGFLGVLWFGDRKKSRKDGQKPSSPPTGTTALQMPS